MLEGVIRARIVDLKNEQLEESCATCDSNKDVLDNIVLTNRLYPM